MKEEKKQVRGNGRFLRMVFGDTTIITMARIALQAEPQRTALLIEITTEPATPIRMEYYTMPMMR